MSRPAFSAALIAELRSRVIAHNESSSDKVTLNQLKKLYERAYKGEKPAERALRKVDEHLAKAFDPSKHPRGKDGKFSGAAEEGASAADHIKRVAGAASYVGEKVKRAAHHAAYQAGLADEPLKAGVEAPDVVPLDLPEDRHVHRALQAKNAGYRALTSDVIPEQRGEIYGALARGVIAGTGGLVVGRILTSKNPDTWARRKVVAAGAYPVGMAAKIAVGVPLHSVAAALKLAEQTLGRKLGAVRVKDYAHDMSDGADAKGKAFGAAVINRAITPMRWGAARILDISEGRTRHPPRFSDVLAPGERVNFRNAGKVARVAMKIARIEGRALGGRAGGMAFLTLGPAMLINSAIQNSSEDPEKMGSAYDRLLYRTIQKALSMPELEELRKAMTVELRRATDSGLRKASPLSELATELEGKAWSRAGAIGGSALASAVGSALGAGTGAGVQAVRNALNKPSGDPYHDAHGRFTSKENAVDRSGIGRAALIGAGVGGALAGGAAYHRMGSLNRAMFHTAMTHLDEHVAGLTSAAKGSAENSAIPELKNAYEAMRAAVSKVDNKEHRANFITDMIAKDKTLNAALEEHREFGNSGSFFYKERARQAINSKLVSILVPLDKFRIPAPKTGEMLPMTAIRRNFSDPVREARKALDGMDAKEFKEAVKDLTPKQQEAAFHWFTRREDSGDEIDKILEGHKAAIVKSGEDLEAKHAALADARVKEADAKAEMDKFGPDAEGPDYERAAKAYKAATSKTASAEKAITTAQTKHDALKNDGPTVISAYDGKPIQPPLPNEHKIMISGLQTDAHGRAADAHDKLINNTMKEEEAKLDAVRSQYLADLQLNHARRIGAFVGLGRKSAGLNEITGRNARDLFKAHLAHEDAIQKASDAGAKLEAEKGALDKLLSDRKAITGKSKDARAAKAVISGHIAQAQEAVAKAEGDAAMAQGVLSGARQAFQKESQKFAARYEAVRPKLASAGPGYMPPEVVQDLMRDVKRAAKAGYDPVARYAVQPTAANLRKVMAYVGPRARGVGASLGNTADRTFKSMLMHQIPITDANGVERKVWAPDPFKVTMLGGSGALLALGEFLHKTSDYGKALLAGDTKAKPPTNLQVEMRRHPTKEREGIFAIHAADPRNKNERIVLAGLRYDEGKEYPVALNPGARLSAVLDQQANRQDNRPGMQQSKSADWLSEGTRNAIRTYFKDAQNKPGNANHKVTISSAGTTLEARNHIATEGKGAADNFKNEFRKKFLGQPVHADAGRFYGALDGLFNTEQSRILTVRDMYHLLTAFGNKGQQQILNPDENYAKSGDDVSEALSSEVSRIMEKAPPRSDAQRDLLRKMVAVVGREKQLSPEDITAISDKIGAPRQTEYSEAAKEPQIPVSHRTAAVSTEPASPEPLDDTHFNLGNEAPRAPKRQVIDQADGAAEEIGSHLGLKSDRDQEMLASAIAMWAGTVEQQSRGRYDSQQSVDIVKNAMLAMGSGPRDINAAFKQALREDDVGAFESAIVREIKRRESKVQKGAFVLGGQDLDDLDVLMKRMPGVPSATAPQPAADPAVAGDIKLGADAARGFEPKPMRGVFRGAQRAASRVYTTAQTPQYKPYVDGSAAVADFAGATLANKVLDRVVKTPAVGENFSLKNPIQGIKSVGSDVKGIFSGGALNAAKNVGGLAAKGLISGGIGSMLYNAVQGAGKGDAYRRNTTPGQSFAMGVGNFAGATAGESAGGELATMAGKALAQRAVGSEIGSGLGAAAGTFLGGPVGTAAGEVAGGAIGAALGEFLTHATLKHFSGYHPAAVQRVLATKVAPPAPGQENAAQTGEIAGGIVGNALGGAAGDGLGGAVGSALGISAARATAPAPALPGRPKTSQGSIP
jgi:hypothetical protein